MVAVRSRVDRLVAPTLRRHLLIALGAAAVLLLLSAQIGAYDDYNLTAVAIFAVAAAGLTLLTGLNGQLSLGHGALMAIGAYTASLLLKDHRQLPVIVVLLISVLSAGVIGIAFGYAAARLRGPYLAGATLTLAVALPQVATRYKSIFGGESGLTVPPSAPPDWLGANFPPERCLAWSAVADNLPLAIYGGILVIAMLVAPHGIQGALRRILAIGRARWEYPPRGGQKGVVDWDDPAPGT